MKVEQEYDRHYYEIHQKSENGKWYRMVSSDEIQNGNEEEMLAQVIQNARERVGWSNGLRGFLPSELIKHGPLRVVLVHRHCTVFDLDVEKVMRSCTIKSKKIKR